MWRKFVSLSLVLYEACLSSGSLFAAFSCHRTLENNKVRCFLMSPSRNTKSLRESRKNTERIKSFLWRKRKKREKFSCDVFWVESFKVLTLKFVFVQPQVKEQLLQMMLKVDGFDSRQTWLPSPHSKLTPSEVFSNDFPSARGLKFRRALAAEQNFSAVAKRKISSPFTKAQQKKVEMKARKLWIGKLLRPLIKVFFLASARAL